MSLWKQCRPAPAWMPAEEPQGNRMSESCKQAGFICPPQPVKLRTSSRWDGLIVATDEVRVSERNPGESAPKPFCPPRRGGTRCRSHRFEADKNCPSPKIPSLLQRLHIHHVTKRRPNHEVLIDRPIVAQRRHRGIQRNQVIERRLTIEQQ